MKPFASCCHSKSVCYARNAYSQHSKQTPHSKYCMKFTEVQKQVNFTPVAQITTCFILQDVAPVDAMWGCSLLTVYPTTYGNCSNCANLTSESPNPSSTAMPWLPSSWSSGFFYTKLCKFFVRKLIGLAWSKMLRYTVDSDESASNLSFPHLLMHPWNLLPIGKLWQMVAVDMCSYACKW